MKTFTKVAIVLTGFAALALSSCKSKTPEYAPVPDPGYIESSSK